jgi:hypothetical protein
MKIKPIGIWIVLATLVPTLLVPGEEVSKRWNVLDAGAKGDAQMDCTEVFQRLLNDAGKAGGGVVEVPAGRFKILAHLSIPANVTLQGIYHMPPTSGPVPIDQLTGSVLMAYEGRGSTNGKPFIKLAGNHATIAGLIVAYPEWKQSDVPPIPYPPCVSSQDTENVGVHDCLLLNPYEGIRLVRSARHLIRNVTGYPIMRGIYVDECYDIGHIENIHFWPFGVAYEAENPYCKWINTQGVAIELARTDWHYVLNTFCFGYGIGYKFSQSKQGSANGNFVGLGADSCQRAVVVDQAQPPGLLIMNGEFVGRWSSTNAVCLEVGPEVVGKVSLVNCSFWGPIDRSIWMRSPHGQLTANTCHFVHWDIRGLGSPAIQLDAGKAIIQGCTFEQDNLHILIQSNVTSAIITANQASGGLRVDNLAGKRAQIALNEEDSVAWTPEARTHYRLEIGGAGDGRYLVNWHGAERVNRPCRWSTGVSRFQLPVNPDEACQISLEASVPPSAVTPETGLYYEGQRIASLTNGLTVVSLPPAKTDRLSLEVRSGTWVPKNIIKDSQDTRALGIQAFSITLRSDKASDKLFHANDGQWQAKSAKP